MANGKEHIAFSVSEEEIEFIKQAKRDGENYLEFFKRITGVKNAED